MWAVLEQSIILRPSGSSSMIASVTSLLLSVADFEGIWDSLVFDSYIKSHLLHYATTTLLFSDHNVDPNIISWNRVVLLHGRNCLVFVLSL